MPKPNAKSSVKELRDYIRKHGLDKPQIKVAGKKAELVSGLKKVGHWDKKHDKKPVLKAPKTTPGKTTMSVKPYGAGKTTFKKPKTAVRKKAKPVPPKLSQSELDFYAPKRKKPKPKAKPKATMTKVLMNYDMDVSAKIGAALKSTGATKVQLEKYPLNQLKTILRNHWKQFPDKKLTIKRGATKEMLIEKIMEQKVPISSMPKKVAKETRLKKSKYFIEGWNLAPEDEDDPDILEDEGWTFEDITPAGFTTYSKMMTKPESQKALRDFGDYGMSDFKMYK